MIADSAEDPEEMFGKSKNVRKKFWNIERDIENPEHHSNRTRMFNPGGAFSLNVNFQKTNSS